MQELNFKFEVAAKNVKTLTEKPDNKTLLELYALYKQAKDGDVYGDEPWFSDFVGHAKWDAWAALKGTSPEEAMKKYIDLVNGLLS